MAEPNTVTVRMTFESPEMSHHVDLLTNLINAEARIKAGLRRVVLQTVVRNIRQRFLQMAETALQMETLPEVEGRFQEQGARQRYNDRRTKTKLNGLFQALSDAQSTGADSRIAALREVSKSLQAGLVPRNRGWQRLDAYRRSRGTPKQARQELRERRQQARESIIDIEKRIQRMQDTQTLRERIGQLQHKLAESQGRDWRGERITPHPLSTGMFRVNMMRVLNMLTDMALLDVFPTRSGLGVGIGNLAVLESVRTPSATQKLTGRPTGSKKQTFWRHLEFGTGIHRKNEGNPGATSRNNAAGIVDAWYYGDEHKGIVALGTKPMNVFTDSRGNAYAKDEQDLVAGVIEMLDNLFGKR